MNLFFLAWVGLAALAVAVAAWYLLRSPSKFSPDQVEAFRFTSFQDEVYTKSTDTRAYTLASGETATENVWKGTSYFLFYRDTSRWVQAKQFYMKEILNGSDEYAVAYTSNAIDKYPFMSDLRGSGVEVRLKGDNKWVALSTLLTPSTSSG